jgi:hypothetical protein
MKKIAPIKRPIIVTVKENNVPKDYKILTKIGDGYVLAMRMDIDMSKKKDNFEDG